MEKVNLPEMKKGEWSVEKFSVDRRDLHGMLHGRECPVGEYTRLMRGDTLVMSDTPAEMRDHTTAICRASGNCLINGLGIGMVLKNILLKESVEKVLVVEISQDLIDLISPFYQDSRVSFICYDAFKYKPQKDIRFSMVWHDIWDSICSDNLPEMTKLHRKYANKTDWQGSWARGECQRYNRGGW